MNSQSQLISKAINRALEIKRQVFVVVPRIDGDEEDESNKLSAKEVYDDYVKEYGEDKVQLLHGRMKKDDQNEVLNKFRNNEKPILISTSIIEVGVDVQEACLMIIYSANYLDYQHCTNCVEESEEMERMVSLYWSMMEMMIKR